MNTHVHPKQTNKSPSLVHAAPQKQRDDAPAVQLVDNRPEAMAQRRLQAMADNSRRVRQLRAFQEMSGNHPQARQVIQGVFIFKNGEIVNEDEELILEGYNLLEYGEISVWTQDEEKAVDYLTEFYDQALDDIGSENIAKDEAFMVIVYEGGTQYVGELLDEDQERFFVQFYRKLSQQENLKPYASDAPEWVEKQYVRTVPKGWLSHYSEKYADEEEIPEEISREEEFGEFHVVYNYLGTLYVAIIEDEDTDTYLLKILRKISDPPDYSPYQNDPLEWVDKSTVSRLHETSPAVLNRDLNPKGEAGGIKLPESDTGGALPTGKTPDSGVNVIHMNYHLDDLQKRIDTEFEHFLFFAGTAEKIGLMLVIFTNKEGKEDIGSELDKFPKLEYEFTITDSKHISQWAEDSVEFLENGNMAVLNKFEDGDLRKGIEQGRKERWKGMTEEEFDSEQQRDEWVPKGTLVNQTSTAEDREKVSSEGAEVGHIRAYIEGGNMITGEDDEGTPIILIGKDAIAATAYAYQIGTIRVLEIIQEDFGLEDISQIICVEQPGKFHLDMGLIFLGNGVVMVNDSSAGLEEKKERASWGPIPKKLAAQQELIVQLENEAVKDLEAAGLKVIRKNLESGSNFNFFNGEFVTGSDKKRYYITNGSGSKEKEEEFRAMMVKEMKLVEDVFFSPSKAAQGSLTEQGGVGCRIKGENCEM